MPNFIDIELAGHQFQLLADRGMYWPARETLFIADTHFGKEATFRRNGVPVPAGSTEGTLNRIRGLLEQTQATQLCILGDMFHARSSLSADVRYSLDAFFAAFSQLSVLLVRGNHDSWVGQMPTNWPVEVVEPGIRMNNVALGHHPEPVPENARLYLCGHLHPSIRVNCGKEKLGKLPCFWHSAGCLVLPAIGQFTGTHLVQAASADTAWVVTDEEVFKFAVPQ